MNLPWYCFGYPTTIRPQLLRAMKAANCHTIFMGVDSGDADMATQKRWMSVTRDIIKNAAQLIT